MPTRPASLTRDDPRYWDDRPADHGGDGLYVDGPHEARASWQRDAGSASSPAAIALPAVARARRALAEIRARDALAKHEAARAAALAAGSGPATPEQSRRARRGSKTAPRPTGVEKLLAALRGRDLR